MRIFVCGECVSTDQFFDELSWILGEFQVHLIITADTRQLRSMVERLSSYANIKHACASLDQAIIDTKPDLVICFGTSQEKTVTRALSEGIEVRVI